MTVQDDQPGGRTLAEKLDALFHAVRDDRGREHSLEDVARAIAERGGPTISATYLWQLRRGVRSNPRMSHLEALAGFFGVDPGYFFPGELAAQLAEQMTVALALRDPYTRRLATVADRLTPASRHLLEETGEHLLVLEGRAKN